MALKHEFIYHNDNSTYEYSADCVFENLIRMHKIMYFIFKSILSNNFTVDLFIQKKVIESKINEQLHKNTRSASLKMKLFTFCTCNKEYKVCYTSFSWSIMILEY